MASFFLSLLMSSQVADLEINLRRPFVCFNGRCFAPVMHIRQNGPLLRFDRPEIRPILEENDRVFPGGRLLFQLRGSSCCG